MEVKHINRVFLCCFWFFALLFLLKIIFLFSPINSFFDTTMLSQTTGIATFIILWILIFLESSIVPGPYIPLLMFYCQIYPINNEVIFIFFCTSAVVFGRIIIYILSSSTFGRMLDASTIENKKYYRWKNALSNSKYSKLMYALTVALPFFPDFVLAWAAAAVKIDFKFYIIVNFIFKFIENMVIVYAFLYFGIVLY